MNPQQNSLLPLLIMMSQNSPRHIDQALASNQLGALALSGSAQPLMDVNATREAPPVAANPGVSPDNPLLMLMGQQPSQGTPDNAK